MTVYSAFAIPTLGMMGQAHALSTIGNNIANITTGGFKRTDTNFSTVLGRTLDKQSDIGGTKPKDLNQITQQGNMVISNRDLDLAINGQGFFVFNSNVTGSGTTYYGRDGSFEMATVNDISVTGNGGSTITVKDGYLVDKNGYFLQGWTADATTGLFTNTTMSSLRIDPYAFAITGQTTTNAALELNLPSTDTAGLAQVSEITLSGTVETGDQFRITVGTTAVTYTVQATDTSISDIRTGLINAVNANGTISALATASASPTDGKILVTAKSQGSALTITSSTPTDLATVDIQAQAAVVQKAKTGDIENYNMEVFDSNGNARSVRLDFAKTSPNTWDLSSTVGKTPVARVDTVTLGGTIETGDIYSIIIEGITFSRTAVPGDTLTTIRDSLITSINADASIKVTAATSGTNALTLTADSAGTNFTATTTTTNVTPVAQVDNVTLTGAYAPGDVVSVNVNGIGAVPYTVIAADLTDNGGAGTGTDTIAHNNIALKLQALIVADGPTSAVITATVPSSGVIALTANTAGTAFTPVSLATTVGNGVATGTTPTANLVGLNDNTNTNVNTTANVAASETTTTAVTTLTFNSDGSLATPAGGSVNLSLAFPIAGTVPAATATVALDINKLTQFAGNFQPYSYTNNGYAAANAQTIKFDTKGNVIATFDNSSFRTVYKIPLAQFSNANALQEYNGNVYRETAESGTALVVDVDKTGYASFLPSTHELSNVDLAGEFTRMMMTQTAYNSSATVFKTVDEMITAARDLKR